MNRKNLLDIYEDSYFIFIFVVVVFLIFFHMQCSTLQKAQLNIMANLLRDCPA